VSILAYFAGSGASAADMSARCDSIQFIVTNPRECAFPYSETIFIHKCRNTCKSSVVYI
jgi:hypothetical protein